MRQKTKSKGPTHVRKLILYLIAVLLFLAVSPGMATMELLLEAGDDPRRAWALFLPAALVYPPVVLWLNERLLIPRLLLRGRFVGYILSSFLVAIATAVGLWCIECAVRAVFDLPAPIGSWSAWAVAEVIGNALFVVPLMVAVALIKLYDKCRHDMARTHMATRRLQGYIADVRQSLNPASVMASLQGIADAISEGPRAVSQRIDALTDNLRELLAHMAPPPKMEDIYAETSLLSPLAKLIADSAYRPARHVLLLVGLLFVSSLAYSSDYVVSPLYALGLTATLFVYLTAIAYISRWIFHRYAAASKTGRYIAAQAVLTAVMVVPMLLVLPSLMRQAEAVQGRAGAMITLGSILAGAFEAVVFSGGCAALLMFQRWLRAQREFTALRAETLRQEYLFLRKQVNPHFLFNVLNNIDITVTDDPALASTLLADLQTLLRYQFDASAHEYTPLNREADFLQSYLSLEQSRRDGFSFELTLDPAGAQALVPTLLFLPAVENAAKYALRSRAQVRVRFAVDGHNLMFTCENPCDAAEVARMKHHGIGLTNMCHRLELIYDGAARMNVSDAAGVYKVEILIPLKYEMHNS